MQSKLMKEKQMPIYVWKNKNTEEIKEISCSEKDKDLFLKEISDPENWVRLITGTKFVGKLSDGRGSEKQKGFYNSIKKD